MDAITQWDLSILDALQGCRIPFLDRVLSAVTHLGDHGIFWIALALVLLCIPRTRRLGVCVALALILDLLLCNILIKPLVARPRPCWLDETVVLLVASPKDYSFPSGHSLCAFIAAVILLRYDRRFGIPALILAILLAFSRLYLFLHFPSDVLAGILLGAGIGLAVSLLGDRYIRRKEDWV